MKGFLQVILVIIVIVIVWMLYVNRQADEREKERQELDRVQEERLRQEMTKQAVPPPAAPSASEGSRPTTVINRATLSKKMEVFEAAKAARVTIINYQEKANSAIIDCRADDRNYLGDFLDELMNRGIMKDLDLNKKQYRFTYDRQGKAIHWAHYEITW